MRTQRLITALLASGLLLAACGDNQKDDASPASEREHGDEGHSAPGGTEVAGPEARMAFTHEGGLTVLRAGDGEVLSTIDLPGFHRLAPAGDERHLMVSTTGGFRVLDLGAWTEQHGDHGHSFTAEPHLTDLTFEAEEPGHVVVHADRTVLFDDATGAVLSFDPHHLTDDDVRVAETSAAHPHHGVAVALADGSMLMTSGDEDSRSGVVHLDHHGDELGRSDACPGVHGEAAVADAVAFGCEDGVLVVDEGDFTKVDSPDRYGRIGNLAGSPESPVLLGDYKTDPDAELERPTQVSLVDTRSGELHLLDLGTSYSFRSLARGPEGEALVLGTDGALHVIDPDAGEVVAKVPVVKEWKEPKAWQEPRPTVIVVDETAWVTEPGRDALHAVDLAEGEVVETFELDQTPNEIAAVTG